MNHFRAIPIIDVERRTNSNNYLNNSGLFEKTIALLRYSIPFTLPGRKLVFYHMFLDFLRVICINIINSNLKHRHELLIPSSDFAQLLLQLNMGAINKNEVVLHSKFVDSQKCKPTRKQLLNYQFILQLIAFYNHNDSQNPIGSAWKRMILDKKLDYEIRLCETLINLEKLEVGKKIKSPFNESYYTGSGKNAFNSYTKPIFLSNVNRINETIGLKNVLDIGCGYGNYIDSIVGSNPSVSVTGVELNPEVATATKLKFNDNPRVTIVNKNIFEYQPDKKYDLILLNYILFYFTSDEKVCLFKHLNSMLSEGGRIMVCQYYSGIENLKVSLSSVLGDTNLSKRIEIYYANKISYANTLWNNTVDVFKEAERFDLFKDILNKSGFYIFQICPADRFYYSFFLEIARQDSKGIA